MTTWKIASFNANSIRARLSIVQNWLMKNQPDVLCVQETKCQDRDFPEEEIRSIGYHVVYRGEKSYNGVAIMSLSVPGEPSFGLGPGPDPDETRLIAVEIDGVAIVNVYVPQGREPDTDYFQYKLDWYDRLLAYLQKNYTPAQPLILIGDINIAPTDQDVHDPVGLWGHADFHPEVQKQFAKVMGFGFEDVFRKHQPGPGQFSFFDYRVRGAVERGQGWRVDHILATRSLAAKSISAWIDLEPRKITKPSDHTPICAEFNLGA